jgi:hypothetical protein
MKTPAILGLLVLALALGTVIGWIDSRPGWDDTGITIGAVLLASAACGLLGPKMPWLWGFAAGSGVAAWGIVLNGTFAGLVALPVAVAGAYFGALVRWGVAGGDTGG